VLGGVLTSRNEEVMIEMRTAILIMLVMLLAPAAVAQNSLTSPYRQQAASGLRGLNEAEIGELRAGTGMGLARAAELNSYPGPRHVLDAVTAGEFPMTLEQTQRIQQIFDQMKRDAQRIGAQILEEEERLEVAFRSATITEPDLNSRVARIAGLQGELRSVHLAAHVATRAVLSETQVARYNELRGYGTGQPADHRRRQGH
jgi:hypothetical protein